jgi:hypothetical protein
VVACCQLGHGIAAFGGGPLVDAGVGLHVCSGSPQSPQGSWVG